MGHEMGHSKASNIENLHFNFLNFVGNRILAAPEGLRPRSVFRTYGRSLQQMLNKERENLDNEMVVRPVDRV